METVGLFLKRFLGLVARNQSLAFIIFAIFIFILPQLIASNYYMGIMVNIAIYTIIVVGLCLLMGFAGQVSLGHAAFYGLGAYGSGILTATYGFSPWIAMIIAAMITALVAFIIGKPILKLKEHYLALATLGFGIIIYIIFQEAFRHTGGPTGLSGIPNLAIGDFSFRRDRQFYYLVWTFTLLAIWLAYNIVDSRIGRALRSIHSSEVAAASMGVDTTKLKLQIFVVSAVYASVAGSLFAHWANYINPGSFGFLASIMFVVMAAVGGMASIWGPVFGVTIILVLVEALRDIMPRFMGHAGGEYEIVVFGVILVLVMIFMPGGVTRTVMDNLFRVLPKDKNQMSGKANSKNSPDGTVKQAANTGEGS
ncbi:MAG: branched-chain amino acid ABC transporter permease [Clostridia bacterium]|nr:branched-chain amino acid ABC transporter permease [Clostridia bacterium]